MVMHGSIDNSILHLVITNIDHATYIVTGTTNLIPGGDIMEKIYDARGGLHGYVDNNTIYDTNYNVLGYTDGSVIYDDCMTPLAYLSDGYVRTACGIPIGYYRGYRLYDMGGNYLGYGNFGFFGLLGASLLFLLFASPFLLPFWWL